jgi:hypothetical protein
MTPRFTHLCAAALAVVGFLSPSQRAAADFINLQYEGNAGGSVDVTLNGNLLQSRLIGPFTWHDTNLSPDPSFNSPIKTFCIEVNEVVVPPFNPPTATFRVTDPASAPTLDAAKAAAIKALYGNYYDFATDSVKDGKNAAFQLAIWEITYDFGNPVDLDSGNFSANAPSSINNDAEYMLNHLAGGLTNYNSSGYQLVALVAPAGVDENGIPAKSQDNVQDHLAIKHAPVPAPPALALAGIGALALLIRARVNRSPATS